MGRTQSEASQKKPNSEPNSEDPSNSQLKVYRRCAGDASQGAVAKIKETANYLNHSNMIDFDDLRANIQKAKAQEAVSYDEIEYHQAAEEVAAVDAMLAEADAKEIQFLDECINQKEKELADLMHQYELLEKLSAEQEAEERLMESINFEALRVCSNDYIKKDRVFIDELSAMSRANDQQVKEIETFLLQIPFMRDYLLLEEECNRLRIELAAIPVPFEEMAQETEEEEEREVDSAKRRREADAETDEQNDGGGDQELREAVKSTSDVTRQGDDNPKDSSELPGQKSDVSRQRPAQEASAQVTSLDLRAIEEKEIRALTENPDLLLGFERDFDEASAVDGELLDQQAEQQQQKQPNAGVDVPDEPGIVPPVDCSSDSLFKRPATPQDLSRERHLTARLRSEEAPIPFRRNTATFREERGRSAEEATDTIFKVPNTSQTLTAAHYAPPTCSVRVDASIDQTPVAHNSRTDPQPAFQSLQRLRSFSPRTAESHCAGLAPKLFSSPSLASPRSTPPYQRFPVRRSPMVADNWSPKCLLSPRIPQRPDPVDKEKPSIASSPSSSLSKLESPARSSSSDAKKASPSSPAAATFANPLASPVIRRPFDILLSTPDYRQHMQKATERPSTPVLPLLRSKEPLTGCQWKPRTPSTESFLTKNDNSSVILQSPLSSYLPDVESPQIAAFVPRQEAEQASPNVGQSFGWMGQAEEETNSYAFIFGEEDQDNGDGLLEEEDQMGIFYQN